MASSIDEVLRRNAASSTPIGPEVAARIRRLNPDGTILGMRLRGFSPHHTWRRARLMYDVILVKEFISANGRAAYRNLPRRAFMYDGKRRAVRYEYVVDHNLRRLP